MTELLAESSEFSENASSPPGKGVVSSRWRTVVKSVYLISWLLIIGMTLWILWTAAYRMSGGVERETRRGVAEHALVLAQGSLVNFRLHCDRFPSSSEGLSALLKDPGLKGWHGPYDLLGVPGKQLLDPWGNAFRYSVRDDVAAVVSAGPDATFDTEDDMKVTAKPYPLPAGRWRPPAPVYSPDGPSNPVSK